MLVITSSARPTRAWVTHVMSNLLMDLEDAGHLARVRFLLRDRDAEHPRLIDKIPDSARTMRDLWQRRARGERPWLAEFLLR
jgi:hypothetical protein